MNQDLAAARADARAFIDDAIRQRQVNRVLHGFPSPRFWQVDSISVPRVMAQCERWNRAEPASTPTPTPTPFSLYVGLPYCIRTDPDRCGYCLFPVETFGGAQQLDIYLNYFEREGELFRDFFAGAKPETLYIGGGTPNLMRPGQYTRMMDIVRSIFPSIDGVPVTMEGIPQLFTREKLESMKAGGINRVSIGVQQLDPELNRLSGRKQTAKHVFDAIEWTQELGLQCNVDLIFGWPRQTMRHMLADLDQLAATGVDHIAHYELNIGGATDFSLNRRDEIPAAETVREMYRTARDFLTANGYRQLTAYDFQKVGGGEEFVYEECKRGFARTASWGWGFAGVSDFGGTGEHGGWTYVNHRRVKDYFAALDRGEFPVERGFARAPQDLRLHELFRNLQGMRVDRANYRQRFGRDVYAEHEAAWLEIAERGWCTASPDAIALQGDGVYYVPLIQALLSQPRLAELRATASSVALAI